MTDKTKPQEHFVVAVENLPPTKIVCACGEVFEGENLMVRAEAHIDVQDAITDLETKLERRNVFDLGKDEETP